MHKWETFKLGEVCVKITDGSHFSPQEQEVGVPMFSVKDMKENSFDYSNVKLISEEDYEKIAKGDCKPLKDDILIAKDGSYLKHIFVCKEERKEVVLSSIAILRPNKALVYPLFLSYVLKSQYIKDCTANYVSGSALPRIILEDFKKVKLSLPPLAEQERIATILGNYDALIANYEAQIHALQASAQQVYKEWFVRGRCPYGEMETEKVGLFEIADVLYGFAFDSTLFNETQEGEPIIRIRDILSNSLKTFTTEIAPDKYYLKNSDILIGMDGDFHITWWLSGKAWINQRVTRLRAKNGMSQVFLYYSILEPIAFLNSIISGTTVAHLGDMDLKKIKITVPSPAALTAFHSLVSPLFLQIENLQHQISVLKTTRDALLPRLLRA